MLPLVWQLVASRQQTNATVDVASLAIGGNVAHLVQMFRLRKLSWGRQKGLYNAVGRALAFLCVGASPRYLILIEQTRAKVHQLARMATSKWRKDDYGAQHRSVEDRQAAGQWLSDR
jgi:hypothetical protein